MSTPRAASCCSRRGPPPRLCSGILGGAVTPLLVGMLGDRVRLRAAMTVVFVTIAYILSVGIWARPLVRNEPVDLTRVLGLSKQS